MPAAENVELLLKARDSYVNINDQYKKYGDFTMKTIEELYHEVMASEDLKQEFLSLKPEGVEGFAKKYGCKATLDEIKTFLTEKSSASGELSDEEIEQIAGGKGVDDVDTPLSFGRFGIGCSIEL